MTTITTETTPVTETPASSTSVETGNVAVAQERNDRTPRGIRGGQTGGKGGKQGGRTGGRPPRAPREKPEFDSKTISIRRVTRVVSGGRRFTLSVALVAGDRNGRIGLGTGKALDTQVAIEKALKAAKRNMITIKLSKTKSLSHDISAKTGLGVKDLLEKVLLEAEILDLKSNPNKAAQGTVVEAFLDKGKGYVSTILVQHGTLRIGDYMLAGKHHGKIKAMHDERGHVVIEAGPSTPVSVLGLDGAATAGDKFNIFEDEKEAKQIASKRSQLMREQSVRTQRHITLDEIGRRIALGQFKELNIIIKGDVDGSVEALADSFSKLSTEEIEIKIIHKGVGAITESDVNLASASDAIIIGFNVRPAGAAKQLAEKEEIDIRNYSIIYDAIDDLKDAMEGMLSPEMKEEITGTAEIREIFKVSKVGTIAGCMITDGKVFRNSKIRLIREGVVIFTGELTALKRFKDDVKEVSKGYDCGIQIKNYNDIQINDIIESFQEIEVKKKLK